MSLNFEQAKFLLEKSIAIIIPADCEAKEQIMKNLKKFCTKKSLEKVLKDLVASNDSDENTEKKTNKKKEESSSESEDEKPAKGKKLAKNTSELEVEENPKLLIAKIKSAIKGSKIKGQAYYNVSTGKTHGDSSAMMKKFEFAHVGKGLFIAGIKDSDSLLGSFRVLEFDPVKDEGKTIKAKEKEKAKKSGKSKKSSESESENEKEEKPKKSGKKAEVKSSESESENEEKSEPKKAKKSGKKAESKSESEEEVTIELDEHGHHIDSNKFVFNPNTREVIGKINPKDDTECIELNKTDKKKAEKLKYKVGEFVKDVKQDPEEDDTEAKGEVSNDLYETITEKVFEKYMKAKMKDGDLEKLAGTFGQDVTICIEQEYERFAEKYPNVVSKINAASPSKKTKSKKK